MQLKLYVTRHGETDYNVSGRYAGSTDVPLNKKGIEQAKNLAGHLSNIKFDVIVSSSMLRARQTADVICQSLGLQYSVSDCFVERHLGVYEGLTRDEVKTQYPEMWNRRCTTLPDDAPEGGETLRQACERVDRGLEHLRLFYGDKCVLLICHGLVARAVHRYCKNLAYDEMSGFVLNNCEIVDYTLE